MCNELSPTSPNHFELGFFQPDDQEALDQLYTDVAPSRDDALRLASERTETFTLENGNRFRAVVLPPEDSDASTVFVPAEFMHGRNHTGGIIRALGIQALNPRSTVVYLPNDRARPGHSHTNLSMGEKLAVWRGDFSPYARRFEAVLDSDILQRDSNDAKDAPMTMFGVSQGADVATAYGAHPDTRATGVVVVEAPNIIDNRLLQLGVKFISSGPELKSVIAENYAGVEAQTTIKEDLFKELGLVGSVRYATGVLRLGNLALVWPMNHATLQPRLQAILKGDKVAIHAWATGADVSPQAENAMVAAYLQQEIGSSRYEAYEFEGDHSMTNNNLVMGALARRAFTLTT